MAASQVDTTTALPSTGRWELDPAHTTVEFSARHLGLARVRGRFGAFTASINVGDSLVDSGFEASIDAATIETRQDFRDQHLRSPDFLDVERFKDIRFVSTRIEPRGDNRFDVHGDLTIRDITKPAVLEIEYHGEVEDPQAATKRAGFSGALEIDREAFGMTWNGAIEIGGFVGKKVKVEIEAEALLAA
ncbi:MAG: YceI family protein [Actinomycetota bacterium]